MEIRFVDAENADFLSLVQQLDEYYFEVVGEVHRRYAKYNNPRLLDARMVAYMDGKAAGCGAWKKSTRKPQKSSAFLFLRLFGGRALPVR